MSEDYLYGRSHHEKYPFTKMRIEVFSVEDGLKLSDTQKKQLLLEAKNKISEWIKENLETPDSKYVER